MIGVRNGPALQLVQLLDNYVIIDPSQSLGCWRINPDELRWLASELRPAFSYSFSPLNQHDRHTFNTRVGPGALYRTSQQLQSRILDEKKLNKLSNWSSLDYATESEGDRKVPCNWRTNSSAIGTN
jgi:hypothetical protein